MAIGVFDSGMGGLTALRAFQAALPDQEFIYLGDSANAPYGNRDQDQVFDLTRAGTERLFALGCDLVILACNTASATALHRLQVQHLPSSGPRRVLGVFVPVIEALTRRDWGDNAPPTHTGLASVALFATRATIASGAFARELRFRARDVQVEGQACPDLVPAIEAGELDRAADLARAHVAQLLQRLPQPQAAVLGCTHYPLIEAAFRDALPPGTTMIDQPGIVAAALADYLRRHPGFAGTGPTRHLTTGDPAAASALASRLLGQEVTFGRA